MEENMQHYKLNITEIPSYNDGIFQIYEIEQTDTINPIEYIKDTSKFMYFEELSISDKLKFDLEKREKKITHKIRIPQTKQITSFNVLKIGDEFHKVFNAYHFTNKDGFKQTDLTLEEYYPQFFEGESHE